MPPAEAWEVLRVMDWGVLALTTSDGAPYGVPLNFALDKGQETLIFHGAIEGRKWSWTEENPEACFTVVARAEVLPGQLTCAYASVMVFGRLVRVTERKAVLRALRVLAGRCQPEGADLERYLAGAEERTAVVMLRIERISGKRRDRR